MAAYIGYVYASVRSKRQTNAKSIWLCLTLFNFILLYLWSYFRLSTTVLYLQSSMLEIVIQYETRALRILKFAPLSAREWIILVIIGDFRFRTPGSVSIFSNVCLWFAWTSRCVSPEVRSRHGVVSVNMWLMGFVNDWPTNQGDLVLQSSSCTSSSYWKLFCC